MSGREPNTTDLDTVLFTFEHFTIHPARFFIDQLDTFEDGYAVVYAADGVTQIYSPSIMGAIQHAVAADQTIQYVASLEEAKTLEGSTEGLLGDALPEPGDVIN